MTALLPDLRIRSVENGANGKSRSYAYSELNNTTSLHTCVRQNKVPQLKETTCAHAAPNPLSTLKVLMHLQRVRGAVSLRRGSSSTNIWKMLGVTLYVALHAGGANIAQGRHHALRCAHRAVQQALQRRRASGRSRAPPGEPERRDGRKQNRINAMRQLSALSITLKYTSSSRVQPTRTLPHNENSGHESPPSLPLCSCLSSPLPSVPFDHSSLPPSPLVLCSLSSLPCPSCSIDSTPSSQLRASWVNMKDALPHGSAFAPSLYLQWR